MSTVLLSQMTTTGVGGPAGTVLEAATEEEILSVVRSNDALGTDLLIIAGGSNLVVSDDGFPGTVLRLTGTGIEIGGALPGGRVLLTVEAGHPWDDFVARSIEAGFGGLAALSGIPGSTGATPVQNVGAYGADVSQSIVSVRCWDRRDENLVEFTNAELEFGYRDSLLKANTDNGSPRYVVLKVTFGLMPGTESSPIAYAELARSLGIEQGDAAEARAVREKVLSLRSGKGMVLDPADRDTYSTGSFFTNPIVPEALLEKLPQDAPRFPSGQEGHLKLSAAWLIDRAGFSKGYGLPGTAGESIAGGRAALSSKHTLAITNRGGASAQDVLAIARAVRAGVLEAFGIELHNEPLLIGCSLG
ncbi:UDP-N-acetylmuramate dehydrogenase [Paeniglutamicibacter cryotolerans]|uniref:UDP-N-acetylenolpyruvoylglucosamine reductase n=1 Tax=Paeniglutamicibacter cryotolerans TaxID=670079 RepID=A0A839QH32_9MICC|nr:UDP-N-acetylmuramate dehydrogenase [Paeniglutamicibacter cryotolerans]MBB2994044.1 UDP-N-acetylmuramate dehydrogenase [Paeniglutamicibacter cryotolerans]